MSKRGLYIQTICTFLVYLIVIIPICSANSLALYFDADIHGVDNVPGFRRKSPDMTVINVTVETDDQTEIHFGQLRLLSDMTKPFSCVWDDATKRNFCELKLSGPLPAGPALYEVQFFDMDLIPISEKRSLMIVVDDLAPEVESFSVSRVNDSILVNYSVSDSAYAASSSVCSGVDFATFSVGGEEMNRTDFDAHPCNVPSGEALLHIAKPAQTVTRSVCIDVYDRMGFSSEACEDIILDFSTASVINASVYAGEQQVSYVSSDPLTPATLVVYLQDDTGIDETSFSVDLSELNEHPDFHEFYRNIDYSKGIGYFGFGCENQADNTLRCEWNNLMIKLAHEFPSITLSVKDSLGNLLNESYPLSIMFDDVSPYVNFIRTDFLNAENIYWVGAGNNTVYVDINEDGSGMAGKRLYLNLESFGPQPLAGDHEVLAPNNCTPGWTCVYERVQVVNQYESGTFLPVSIVALESGDDAGNWIEGKNKEFFGYDNAPPEILNVVNSSICPSAPGTIELLVNVSEKHSGSVRAIVDATPFSTDLFPRSFDCAPSEDDEDIWECAIEIGNLVTLYVKDNLNITVVDLVNNSELLVIEQEVCEAIEGVEPNLFDNEAFPVPAELDRIIAGKIAFPAFAQVDFKPKNTNADIEDVQITGCVADIGEIVEPYVVTPFEFDTTIIGFKVALSPDAVGATGNESIDYAPEDEMEVICNMNLIVRSGQKIYTMPEHENVTFTFGLYGTVFGGLNQSMLDKIADIEKDIKDTKEEAHSYDTAINVLGTICTLAEVLAMIAALLQVIKLALYIVGWVVFAVVWASCSVATLGSSTNDCYRSAMSAGSAIYYMICWISDYITTIITTFAWQVDSNPVTAYDSLGFWLKLVCAWFTCRLSETNNFVEVTLDSGSADGGRYTYQVDGSEESGQPNDAQSGYLSSAGMTADSTGATSLAGVVFDYDWSPYRSYHVAKNSLCLPGMKYNLLKKEQNLCMKKNCYEDLVSSGFSPEACDKMYDVQQCLYFDSAAWRAMDEPQVNSFTQGMLEWLMTQVIGALLSWGMRSANCGYPYGIPLIKDALEYDDTTCGGDTKENLAEHNEQVKANREARATARFLLTPAAELVFRSLNEAAYKAAVAEAEAEVAATKGPCIQNVPPTCALVQGASALMCGALMGTAIWLDVGDWMDWEELTEVGFDKYDANIKGTDYCKE